MTHAFPEGFAWGSGTSAYQVEGAWDVDGKAPSVWDTALHTVLQTPDGTSGDTAIDQYHRYEEDIDLLKRLGGGVHRFSVAWPRIITDAAGTVNPAGLDYYERFVDALLARDIAPALNLYHWDTPQWMEDLGGMMNRDFAARFAELASVLGERLGDRVAQWFTMNEPTHPSLGGYVAGFLPPARREGAKGMAAVHHLLLAHGTSIQALRAVGVRGEIGTILSLGGVAPATTHPADVRAAERAEYFEGRLFLDPMLGRGHLPELTAVLGDVVHDGDLETIAQPMDVLGVNWYSRYSAAAPERAAAHLADAPPQAAMFVGLAPATAGLGFAIVPTPGVPWGGAHRQLTPGGLRHALDWVAETYPEHPDMVITENGVGYADIADADGFVQDDERIEYLTWALTELSEAIADGARVRGYHVWSSFDNFQWMSGFAQRFGLIHVDADTLVRTPKASFEWFAGVVRANALPEPTPSVFTGDQVGIDLPGVRNARGIGGLRTVTGRIVKDGLLFRTAGLHHLGDDGREALARRDVTAVLDLRGQEEARRAPDLVPDARLVHLPLHEPVQQDAGAVAGAAADVLDGPTLQEIYLEIVQERAPQLVAGIREVLTADGATVVHCTAGKDRTGVFVAVLLAALEVRDDDIVRTYAESANRLGEGFVAEAMAVLGAMMPDAATLPPSVVEKMLASPPAYIEETLAVIRREHGTVAACLQENGLTASELQQLREKFLR